MTPPGTTRNPILVLGALMLLGLGGLILVAGLAGGGGRVGVALVGGLIFAAGLGVLASSRVTHAPEEDAP